MPNRDGFTTAHGMMRDDGKPDVATTACMSNCAGEIRLSSQMPDYARDSHGNLAEQTRPVGAVEGIDTSRPPGAPGAPPTHATKAIPRPSVAPTSRSRWRAPPATA